MENFAKVGKAVGKVTLIGVGSYLGFLLLDALATRTGVKARIKNAVAGDGMETDSDGFDAGMVRNLDAELMNMN